MAFSIPAFFVFLRIEDWTTFLSSVIIAFMVEIGGVYLVTRGENVMQQVKARLTKVHVMQQVKARLTKVQAVKKVVAKAEAALGTGKADSKANENATKLRLLANKIFHEEYCEKLSLVRVRCCFLLVLLVLLLLY